MAFNINEIRSQLTGGGARPTLFQVQITNPANNSGDLKLPFMCKAAALPTSNLGTIEVGYFGRKIKVAGDRTFDEWTVTIINDEDFLIRNAMEEWSNSINLHQQNTNAFGTSAPSAYKSQATVQQYGKDGSILRTYNFNGLFPTNVSEIGMDWDSNDTLEEFTVTFQYDWWNVSGGITGNAGGQ
jgi:hypothetical protein